MAQKKIALHGSSRGNNFGDILLISLYKDWITEAGHSVILNNADKFCARYLRLQPDVSTSDCVKRADLLVFSGGGYFGEPNNPTWRWYWRLFRRHLLTAIRFNLHRKHYAIFGVEVGPISSWLARRITVWVMNNADTVSVRNDESVNYLRKYGVRREIFMVPDSALVIGLGRTLIKDESNRAQSDRKKIVLHLVIDPDANYEINKERLAGLVKYLNKNINAQFTFMVDSGAGKNNLRFKFLESLNKDLELELPIKEYEDPSDTLDFISHSDIVITTKLHVAITAYALGKHVIGISRHQKSKRFFSQIGLSNCHYELSDLNEDVYNRVLEQIKNNERLQNPSKQLMSDAFKNKDLLFDFLKDNKS